MELAKLRSALSHLRFFKINIKNNCQNVCALNVHAIQCGVKELRSSEQCAQSS